MQSTTKTKWLAWSAVAGFVALSYLCYPMISSRLYVTKTMKVLHSTSDLASRSYQGSSGTGDFVYQMKGPLPEAEFRTCVETLGLTQYDPEQHGALSDPLLKDLVSDPRWWNETSGLDHYYFRNSLGDRFVVRAKWEDGQIYFLAIEPGLREWR